MKSAQKLVVRGRQRVNIDPTLLVQVLMAIGKEWQVEAPAGSPQSPDALNAAVRDGQAAS